MNKRKKWPNKQAARQFIAEYDARVDTVDKNGNLIPGPKGLSYWSAKDYVSRKADQ